MARPIQSLLGNPVQDYFPYEHKALAQRAIEAAFEAGQPSSFETVAALGDNKRFFTCQVIPVLRDGKTTSALMLSRDMTERKHMEMQLIAAERLAAVGALAAGVAHEINTPVQFVSDSVVFLRDSHAELMVVLDKLLALHESAEEPERRRQLTAEARTCVEQADLEYLRSNIPQAIERSIAGLKRVGEIVRSLKAFSHLDHKEMEEAQLDQLIDNSLTLAAHEYKYVAEIVRDYADIPTVHCHVGSLSQVILNLVVNAAHAIAEKTTDKAQLGRITIGLRDQGEAVLITISDTGAGIPENIRTRIFAPFFTTKPVGKGTGQGLAISWNIVTQEHRGQIWFESEVGVGTTFFVRIAKDPKQPLTDTVGRLAS
jgi:signal transduction histidine kinase